MKKVNYNVLQQKSDPIICAECNNEVEYTNDEGICEECLAEYVSSIYEARNDRDWEKIKKIP